MLKDRLTLPWGAPPKPVVGDLANAEVVRSLAGITLPLPAGDGYVWRSLLSVDGLVRASLSMCNECLGMSVVGVAGHLVGWLGSR